MNERIRELAEQILPNEKEFHQGDPTEWGYFFTGEELEKFALLVVQECAMLCNDVGNALWAEQHQSNMGTAQTCKASIEKTFRS